MFPDYVYLERFLLVFPKDLPRESPPRPPGSANSSPSLISLVPFPHDPTRNIHK